MSFEVPNRKAEDIEAKRSDLKLQLASKFGMNVQELDSLKIEKPWDPEKQESSDAITGNINGVPFTVSKGKFEGNWDKGYRANINNIEIKGDAAERIFSHFEHVLKVRDGRVNQEAADDAYDAHQIEIVSKISGGEAVARRLLGIKDEQ